MTGRERMLNALNGKETDVMPVTLFIQGQGHFITQVNPDTDPIDYVVVQKNVIDFQKELGLDVHARMLFFDREKPLLNHQCILNIYDENENWKIKESREENGNTVLRNFEITTPEGVLKQTLSVNEYRPGTYMYGCTSNPIKTKEDLEIALKYEPNIGEDSRARMKESVRKVKEMVGDDGIVSAWSNGGRFNNIGGLIDQNLLYMLPMVDLEFYEMLMEFSKKRTFDFTGAIIDAGVDALCCGGNVASGFLGEKFFDEYVQPYEKEYVEFIQSKGIPVVYHNCGLAMALVESYKKIGMNNVEPFSPAPLGDGDLDKLAETVTDEFTVTCTVDQVNVIQNGTPEQVREVTLTTIEKAKKFKNAIIQNTDFLEYGTPIENVKMFAKTALENR